MYNSTLQLFGECRNVFTILHYNCLGNVGMFLQVAILLFYYNCLGNVGMFLQVSILLFFIIYPQS